MGEQAYALEPIGAGPFVIESDQPNQTLVLKRNPSYWQKGHPYLQTLKFIVVGNDQTAYDALVTGQAQAYEGYGSVSTLASIEQQHKVRVTALPARFGPSMVTLNSKVAPFNNVVAREAISYATSPKPIDRALDAHRGLPAESPTIRGGLYDEANVPRYRTYDLAKAKALVKQLGGLKFTILGSEVSTEENTIEALKSQWAQAGMEVTIGPPLSSPQIVQDLTGGKWQASLEGAGGFDPAIGIGLTFWYASKAKFSGIDDPTLDKMIAEGSARLNASQQDKIHKSIWKYISDQAYTPFLYETPMYDLSLPFVSAPGLSKSGHQIFGQDAKVRG